MIGEPPSKSGAVQLITIEVPERDARVTPDGGEGRAGVVRVASARVAPGSDVDAGDPVQPGSAVQVNYCGVGQTTRTMFDSSWVRGKPASFGLNQVIKGWTDGLPGMKPGGRRLLIIPADQAYGDNPRDDSGILPGETLIFVVDMIASSK